MGPGFRGGYRASASPVTQGCLLAMHESGCLEAALAVQAGVRAPQGPSPVAAPSSGRGSQLSGVGLHLHSPPPCFLLALRPGSVLSAHSGWAQMPVCGLCCPQWAATSCISPATPRLAPPSYNKAGGLGRLGVPGRPGQRPRRAAQSRVPVCSRAQDDRGRAERHPQSCAPPPHGGGAPCLALYRAAGMQAARRLL